MTAVRMLRTGRIAPETVLPFSAGMKGKTANGKAMYTNTLNSTFRSLTRNYPTFEMSLITARIISQYQMSNSGFQMGLCCPNALIKK